MEIPGIGRSTDPAPADPPTGRPADRMDRRLRTAWWLVFCALLFVVLQIPTWTVITVSSGIGDSIAAWRVVLGAVAGVPLTATVVWMLVRRLTQAADPVRDSVLLWSSAVLLALVIACFDMWVGTALIAGTWWSVVWMFTSARWRVATIIVLLVLPVVRGAFFEDPNWALVAMVPTLGAAYGLLMLSGNLGTLWLWELASDAVAGRQALSRLAVSEERLRFARDMHDLLGHSLSGVAVKSELAARLAHRDPDRASAEMLEVQRTAREALREVRMAVTGYRTIDLGDELSTVRGVLGSAGIRCRLTGSAGVVPAESRTVLAWVVREAGTNIVRHSRADRCDIVLRRDSFTVSVDVYNNGAGTDEVARGNGLTGLAERVTAAGGTLSASRSGADGFLLRAVLPVASGPGREHIGPDHGADADSDVQDSAGQDTDVQEPAPPMDRGA